MRQKALPFFELYSDEVGGFGCWIRNVRDGTVRLALGSAGLTKKVSLRVMKPPGIGETVTYAWSGFGGGSGEDIAAWSVRRDSCLP